MQRFLQEGASVLDLAPITLDMNPQLEEGRFSDVPVTSMVEYVPPRLEPLCYPGQRPEHAFTTSEGLVWPINVAETDAGPQFGVNTPEGIFDLDDALRFYGVATMDERVPVVGFGSNACPGQLGEKFSEAQNKWGDITAPGDHHIIPTLRGSLRDVAAAYSSKIGIHGYVFAELIEAEGAETEVFVNFLSPGQLQRMVRSESAYELCDLGGVQIDGLAEPIAAYGFAGKNEVLLDADGHPILLDSVCATGTNLSSMSEAEVLTMLAQEFGPDLDAVYPNSPFFANDASSLMAYMSYRTEFLRRQDKGNTAYKNHPAEGEPEDALIGPTLQGILRTAGRVSNEKLLDHLHTDKRNVTPRTFGDLYKQGRA